MTAKAKRAVSAAAGFEVVVLPSGNHVVRPVDERGSPPSPRARLGTVNWYVPYTVVHPQTVAGAPVDAVWVDVSPSPESYFAALASWWARGESFAVLEHDVVGRPDVVAAFEACPEPWCLYGYSTMCHPECNEAWRNMLGCTRFRAEAIAAVPDAVSSIPAEGRDWHGVCDGLGNNLRAAGLTHHWHEPCVVHHTWPSQGGSDG